MAGEISVFEALDCLPESGGSNAIRPPLHSRQIPRRGIVVNLRRNGGLGMIKSLFFVDTPSSSSVIETKKVE